MCSTSTVARTVIFGLILTAGAAYGNAQQIVVKIVDPPRDGMPVGKGMTVSGTASVPSGYHVWVLCRRIDYEDVWWPQGEGKIDPSSKEWKVAVTFGQEDDIKWDFQIGVMVFNEEGHIILQEYRNKALKSGDWKPVEVPATAATPQIIKVKKTSNR